MHEFGLMQDAIDIAQAHAGGADQILKLHLRVGELSGVEPDSLRFAFEVLAPQSCVRGAELEIEHVPVVCHCEECQSDFTPTSVFYICPTCGRLAVEIKEGREFQVTSIEVN